MMYPSFLHHPGPNFIRFGSLVSKSTAIRDAFVKSGKSLGGDQSKSMFPRKDPLYLDQ